MDYEKKYNEALERASHIKDNNTVATPQEVAEHIFPELRESEDERIINQLITLVNSAGEVLFIPTNKEELVAWLNKYKESLHVHESCKENADSFTCEDERIRKELIIHLEQEERSATLEVNKKRWREMISYLEKQKEQNHDGKKWIYEDDYHKDMERTFNDGKDEVLENPEKYGLCKKAKWSEEDEDAIQQAILALEDRYDEHEPNLHFLGYKLPFNKAAERLKSLRPSWKPSEEQMNCLCAAVDAAIRKHNESVSGYEPARVLKSLYEQLKKTLI